MTTKAELIVDTSKPSDIKFADLPTPDQARKQLELGASVQSGTVQTTGTPPPKETPKTKLAGKFDSPEQLETAYKELETRLGRQGQELGQIRSLADKLLDLKRTEDLQKGGAKPEPVQVTSDDLLRDPRGTIEKVAKASVADLQADLQAQRAAMIERAFTEKHPTYREDMASPQFADFVTKSALRTSLAQRARDGDVAAADELFTLYEENKPAPKNDDPKPDEQQKAQERAEELRKAAMVSGGSASEGATKPIYSRQKIIELRLYKPDEYNDPAFQALLTQAYLEGRVK